MMTSYKVMYQIRRRSAVSIPKGDWQDKEDVVVAGDNAVEAIDEIGDNLRGYDFRLKGVEIVGQITKIVKSIISETNSTG